MFNKLVWQMRLTDRCGKFAKSDGYAIISKDSDFSDLATVEGPRPKVIIVALGNCSTRQIESLLRMKAREIQAFGDNLGEGLLIIP